MKATIIGQQSSGLLEGHAQSLYLSPVQAGFPSPAEDCMEGPLDLHEHLVRHKSATFFLRAIGAAHNKVVIAALDGELTVKTVCPAQWKSSACA